MPCDNTTQRILITTIHDSTQRMDLIPSTTILHNAYFSFPFYAPQPVSRHKARAVGPGAPYGVSDGLPDTQRESCQQAASKLRG